MSQRPRQPAEHRRQARTHEELPQQRTDADEGPTGPPGPDRGGTLVAHTLAPSDSKAEAARVTGADPVSAARRLIAWFRERSIRRDIGSDALALGLALADVWLVFPGKAQTYNIVLSFVACAAMLIRRKWPFVAVLVTVPGFLAGWAKVASIIALVTLAKRLRLHWTTWVGAGLVFTGAYVLWPLADFFELTWQRHISRVINAVIYAGGSMAVGLLISMRQELTARIAQVAASRGREIKLREQTVRAAERARLAREMHDVVSHQVTLIAMQAGALQVSASDEDTKRVATTIRELSTHTLEELRNLVGVLRSGAEDENQPGLDELSALTREFDIPVTVAMEGVPEHLPTGVSQAAYRTVQEALTNVCKHAVGAGASVRVVGGPDSLLVEVLNDKPRTRSSGLPSGGHGLLGLRERTGLLGGTFHAGPTPEGGFRVEATYPIET